jgi:hypothetical protein
MKTYYVAQAPVMAGDVLLGVNDEIELSKAEAAVLLSQGVISMDPVVSEMDRFSAEEELQRAEAEEAARIEAERVAAEAAAMATPAASDPLAPPFPPQTGKAKK